jgi:SAM-dependent methyltransferase
MSMGAGAMAGAAANGALVEEDFAITPAVYWENRYADPVWSGRPNRTLVDVVDGLEPGRALDLGCGEGADTMWLAEHGWDATGMDISHSAIDRARGAATTAHFEVADLENGVPAGEYDLVTASFFQSPVALDRARILRIAADAVAPRGRLLLISHAAPPPWAADEHAHGGVLLTPEDEITALALDPAQWAVEIAETRSRDATAPDGTPSTLDDTVVLVRRIQPR